MKKTKIYFNIIVAIYLSLNSITFAKEQSYKIISLVNDTVITNYDLEKRLKLFSFLNNTEINDKNINHYANEMLKLMIDEKLQLEQINKYEVGVKDEEIEEYMKRAFVGPNQKINDFYDSLKFNNIDIEILKESISIQIGWNELAGLLYYRASEINKIDLAKIIEQDPLLTEEQGKNILIQKQITLRAKKLLRDLRAEANIENR